VDLPTGINAGIAGFAELSPIICFNFKKPVSGRLLIKNLDLRKWCLFYQLENKNPSGYRVFS